MARQVAHDHVIAGGHVLDRERPRAARLEIRITRLADVRRALTTMPDARVWLACVAVAAIFVACAGTIGVLTQFLRPAAPHLAPRDALVTAAAVFVQPVLVVQVENGTDKIPTRTDLAACVKVLQDACGTLSPAMLAHCFEEDGDVPAVRLSRRHGPRGARQRPEPV